MQRTEADLSAPERHAAPTSGQRAVPDGAPDVGLYRVLRDDGGIEPVTDPSIDPAVLVRGYREMKRLRLIDARMMLLQRQGRVGFYGACTGQEAVPIGCALALRPEDWVFQALRESSMMLVRGLPLVTYLCQIFGNGGDLLKGRMQPSHMSARQVRQVSWSSCIGTQLPHAVGVAMAAKARGEPIVALTFVGDGGTSEPDFHHALNFAAVYRVPCVIVCQNNHFAISVRSSQQSASATFAIKGRAYGIPSARIDGNDLAAVYHAVSRAVARARRGDGPSFIEAVTYRVAAHSSSDDPSRYRSQEEVDAWVERDPMLRLRRHLHASGRIDDEMESTLEEQLGLEVGTAIREAEAFPPPDRASLFDDVYAELPWHLREQRELLLGLGEADKAGGPH